MAAILLTSAAVLNDQHFHKSQLRISVRHHIPTLIASTSVWATCLASVLDLLLYSYQIQLFSHAANLKAGDKIMSTGLADPIAVLSRDFPACPQHFEKHHTQSRHN